MKSFHHFSQQKTLLSSRWGDASKEKVPIKYIFKGQTFIY